MQIQRSSLKVGPPRGRYYDPDPIESVERLDLTAEGVSVRDEFGERLDVHHVRHQQSKNRATSNGVSIGFTAHYDRMRERFGAHLCDGIAGENILVETSRDYALHDLSNGLLIAGEDDEIRLGAIAVAHPCTEFSRFALNDRAAEPMAVSHALRFLDDGTRGFYARVDSLRPQTARVGDLVFIIGGTGSN